MMRIKVWVIFLLAFPLYIHGQSLDRQTFGEVFKKVNNSVITIKFSTTEIVAGQPKTVEGKGSGVIISADGFIISNKHVVSNKTRSFKIILASGQEVNASFVGMAPDTDISLLKLDSIPQGGIKPITFGDSDLVEEGDWVLAIGSPFGLGGTLTVGIVSAKARTINVATEDGNTLPHPLIQTDAAINPGNSGGALVNMDGELIGVPTMILGRVNIGIGFAIPSNVVKKVVADIVNQKKEIGSLGILVQAVGDLLPAIKQQLGVNSDKGVVVTAFEKNSPAEKAGIKQYDTIISVDGQDIVSVRDFQWAERNLNPGETVVLKIQARDSLEISKVNVVVGKPAE